MWKKLRHGNIKGTTPSHITIDQKKLENVKYFNYLDSMITNYARCAREMQSRIALVKAELNRKKTLFTRKFDLNLRKKRVKCYV
jgi:hypothetical protein